MGLSVAVGMLADLLVHDEEGAEWLEESLAVANRVLANEGLPTFDEPRTLGPMADRTGLDGLPYSQLHWVRRAYAYAADHPGQLAPPLAAGTNPAADPIINNYLGDFFCHLVNHSDAEGFYVPVDFAEILFDDELPGAIMGSSYRLRDELAVAAGALGITIEDGVLSDAEAARINEANDGFLQPGGHMSWLTHWEAVRLSIEHHTAIVYT